MGEAVGGDELELIEADGAVVEGVLGGGEGGRGGVGGVCGLGWGRRRGSCGLPGHAAEEGFEADEEDIQVEGLGEVVIGAGLDAFEDVLGAGARGEHEDGGVAASVAEGAGDGEAVGSGEHAVEEDGGGGVWAGCGRGEKGGQGFVAVGEMLGAVALGFEVEEETLGEVGFVFDEGDEGRFGHWIRTEA